MRPNILECTIRDGNYAVDFNFTKTDTILVTEALDRLGFEWIEIGHGLGLGASEAGKGAMPATDEEIIRAARTASRAAKIGMFFIPRIGRMEQLAMARDAGLDFVRIGYNATEIEETFPYVSYARDLGLIPFVNMMKTYGISALDFGDRTASAADAGAEVVYCVDSAGCMLPHEVEEYVQAARRASTCPLGFHGHNNLMLAVANSVRAFEAGASFIDSTLYGLGRSAGNAQTEVLVAVLERMGVRTGIDLFQLMDLADSYFRPIVEKTELYSMLSVAIGYGRFHSSFLPQVAAAVRDADADLRRVIVAMGHHDPNSLDEAYLQSTSAALAGSRLKPTPRSLAELQSPIAIPGRISNTIEAAQDLIAAMVVAKAKKPGAHVVVVLKPSQQLGEDQLLVEYLCSDSQAIIGQVTYGSPRLRQLLLEQTSDSVSAYLFDRNADARHDEWLVQERAGKTRVIPVDGLRLKSDYLREFLENLTLTNREGTVLFYGLTPVVARALQGALAPAHLFLFGSAAPELSSELNLSRIDSAADRRNLSLTFDAVVLCVPPLLTDLAPLRELCRRGGQYISVGQYIDANQLPERVVYLDLNNAFLSFYSRFLSLRGLMTQRDSDESH